MAQTNNLENTQAQNQFFAENPNFLEIMPKISPEANVFIKNLNPQTTTKDLEAAFRIYGNILSSKIATDSFGNSMGYGYIQFEYKESAEQCNLKFFSIVSPLKLFLFAYSLKYI